MEAGDHEAVLRLLEVSVPNLSELVNQEVSSFITESKQVLNQ
jgi:hypothetical protein